MKVCKNCGAQNKDTSLFCEGCGTRLEEAPVVETPVAEETAAPVIPPVTEAPATEAPVAPPHNKKKSHKIQTEKIKLVCYYMISWD